MSRRHAPRRAGDPPALYADSSKAKTELNWQPKYTTIEPIVASAWKWHSSHPDGFGKKQAQTASASGA